MLRAEHPSKREEAGENRTRQAAAGRLRGLRASVKCEFMRSSCSGATLRWKTSPRSAAGSLPAACESTRDRGFQAPFLLP